MSQMIVKASYAAIPLVLMLMFVSWASHAIFGQTVGYDTTGVIENLVGTSATVQVDSGFGSSNFTDYSVDISNLSDASIARIGDQLNLHFQESGLFQGFLSNLEGNQNNPIITATNLDLNPVIWAWREIAQM